ncbi:MAG: type II toxin-antitoxin system RatA family toxin [Rubrivivax sp.]|nr:type II toxin-antitoxin system RatA family toxin [Rubrivivax sp.]
MEIRRSALVGHPAERMFELIEAAEHYPAFLPWCASATIIERTDELVAARIEVAWRGARFSFVTRNAKRRPQWMSIGLAEGPFRRFEGHWQLTPLSDWGCRVEFVLSYDFAVSVVGSLAGLVFDPLANTLMDAFIQRADQVALLAPPPAPAALPAPPAPPAALESPAPPAGPVPPFGEP